MIVLIGTVPYKTGLYVGKAMVRDKVLEVDGISFPVERGTAAMAASCAEVCSFYNLDTPFCILGGDVADGKGTDLMFQEVVSNIGRYQPDLITLHYMFPKIKYGDPFLEKIASLPKRPQLIADAGGMYLMKTIGKSHLFDVFTPDQGELYFLADEFAPHPLYVRNDLLNESVPVETLMDSAYKSNNTATTTVVKGAVDYIYENNVFIKQLAQPNIPAMEAIGGTGDTITGMLSAFRGMGISDADYKALVINRVIGELIRCNPATQIIDFIRAIPRALEIYEKNIS